MSKYTKIRTGATSKVPTQQGDRVSIPDQSVGSAKLQDLAVTAPKIGPKAVTDTKIDDTAVGYVLKHARNYIINGNMEIAQRGISTATAPNGTYVCDRWGYFKNGTTAVHTVSQSTDVPTVAQAGVRFKNSLALVLTTADASMDAADYVLVQNTIEGYHWQQLAQKQMTLSFWVKATITGLYSVSFSNNSGDRTWVGEYTINSTGTWEKKTIIVDASPSAGGWDYAENAGLRVRFALMAGGSSQAAVNTWLTTNSLASGNQVNGTATNGAEFRITGVMLNEGNVAAPFSLFGGNPQGEFEACQRYYFVWQNVGVGGIGDMIWNGTATNQVRGIVRHPVHFRPVVATLGLLGVGSWTFNRTSDFGTISATISSIVDTIPLAPQNQSVVYFNATASVFTSGHIYGLALANGLVFNREF